eukprot:jgi/Galph1/5313/GphlegSOOS_G3977.1
MNGIYCEAEDKEPLMTSFHLSCNEEQQSSSFQDVTDIFTSAAKQMTTGEMIYSENFSLQNTLTAVLVGDAIFDRKTIPQKGIEDFEKQGSWIAPENLDNSQVDCIMRKFVVCFSSWLDGQSFRQTIYSCLYFRYLSECDETVLKHFFILAIRTCQWVEKLIIEGQVVQEEDYVPCQTILNQLLPENIEEKYVSISLQKSTTCIPLQFMFYFSKVFEQLQKQSTQGLYEARHWIKSCHKVLEDMQSNLNNLQNVIGFDDSIISLSTETGVFRNRPLLSFSGCIEKLLQILNELEQLFQWIEKNANLLQQTNHIFSLLVNISFFTRRSQLHIITRSMLYHSIYHFPLGVLGTPWHMTFWLNRMLLAQVQLGQKKQSVVVSEQTYLVHRIDFLMEEIVRILCFNRGRQRRKLLKALHHLNEIIALAHQQHMNYPNMNYFSSFLIELGYFVAIQHLLLGFECELYDMDEYAAIYFVIGYFYSNWSQISDDLLLGWKTREEQQQFRKTLQLLAYVYKASSLLWEWQQQLASLRISKQAASKQHQPLMLEENIRKLCYEFRFSSFQNCPWMTINNISFSMLDAQLIQPIALCFQSLTGENMIHYFVNPLQTLLHSIKELLEESGKHQNWLISYSELLRWTIHHVVYLSKCKTAWKEANDLEWILLNFWQVERQWEHLPKLIGPIHTTTTLQIVWEPSN